MTENKRDRSALIAAVALLVMVLAAITFSMQDADASTSDEPCVPSEAWTETIQHPAVTHTETVVVSEAVPEVWANFSPNDTKGTFIGPAVWPTDPRGTWNIHDKIPGGHVGPDGVYAQGNPDKGGNWFYRQAGKPEVTEEVVVVDEEAWTETIEHPAVVCPTPTEEPTDTPSTGTPTDTPSTPGTPSEEPSPVTTPQPTDEATTEAPTPQEPEEDVSEPDDDPVVSTHTSNQPDKTVKTFTHKSGKVTREVIRYEADRVEEGL